MDTRKKLSEKVETFLNLLVSISTGGQATDVEYSQLRRELVDEARFEIGYLVFTHMPRPSPILAVHSA